MADEVNIAEEAFVNAVVASMKTQAEILPLHHRLQRELEKIASANERVLRSQGITDDSPLESVLAEQRKYMDEAIKRSGFDEKHPVVKALRMQLRAMEEEYRVMSMAMDEKLGKVNGPEL